MTANKLYTHNRGGELWIGSFPPAGPQLAANKFDILVLAAVELQPPVDMYPGMHLLRCPINDQDPPRKGDIEQARECALDVAWAVRNGFRVLVTCAQGRNRSGLIVGLALRRLTEASGKDVLALVRSRRKEALTNRAYAREVRGWLT
jgi:protein-tyrosine phosphatase